MLEAKIVKYFHPGALLPIFKNVNICLEEGVINILLGMSGVGKTTMINIFACLYRGKLFGCLRYKFEKQALSVDVKELRNNAKIGVLSQNPSLIPWLTIKSNLIFPSKLNGKLSPPTNNMILNFLDHSGLKKDILAKYPHEISGGMQQRVAFIRTILYEPRCLLLDEIYTGLDTLSAQKISMLLINYLENSKCVCVVVTHDIDKALELSKNLYFLSRTGTVVKLDCDINKKNILKIFSKDYESENEALSNMPSNE